MLIVEKLAFFALLIQQGAVLGLLLNVEPGELILFGRARSKLQLLTLFGVAVDLLLQLLSHAPGWVGSGVARHRRFAPAINIPCRSRTRLLRRGRASRWIVGRVEGGGSSRLGICAVSRRYARLIGGPLLRGVRLFARSLIAAVGKLIFTAVNRVEVAGEGRLRQVFGNKIGEVQLIRHADGAVVLHRKI